jgi:hypothetical protein
MNKELNAARGIVFGLGFALIFWLAAALAVGILFATGVI